MQLEEAMPSIVKKEQIPAHNGKHVTKIALENGTVGWLASDVPMTALEGLMRKLLRRQAKLQKRSKV